MEAPDQKPLVAEMEMMADQQLQEQQQRQFAQHFEMIKNEKTEMEAKNLFEDMSGKKQKLDL